MVNNMPGRNIRKRISSRVKGIASVEVIVPLINREDDEKNKQWLTTTRSQKDNGASGEFPLVEHMSSREKWIGKVRNRQRTILTTTYRGIKEELFHKSKLPRYLIEDMYPLQGAFWYPFDATLKLGSRKLSVPANIYGVVLKQNQYDVEFNLNGKELSAIRWSCPDSVRKSVKPQVLQYVPSTRHPELEQIIDQTLSGNLDFGSYTLTLSSPGVVSAEYFLFLPSYSPKTNPVLHAFSTDCSYKRMLI
jgi:hypothetical protein